MGRVISLHQALKIREQARQEGHTFVFTNGCFDLLHRGHVELLEQAKSLGDLLLVGLNSDRSVRRLKGAPRPLTTQADRAFILRALACVDYVLTFDAATPRALIAELRPDVLVKGGDWPVQEIVGRDIVTGAGGRVVTVESSVPHYSTSALLRKLTGVRQDETRTSLSREKR